MLIYGVRSDYRETNDEPIIIIVFQYDYQPITVIPIIARLSLPSFLPSLVVKF